MFTFNYRGHLVPSGNIKCTPEQFKNQFVDTITSAKRVELYHQYIRYCDDLKKVLGGSDFLHWIDGSYVTRKAEPRDIDLVSFIDGNTIDNSGKSLDHFKYPGSLENYGVDAYLVRSYQQDDRKHPLFIGDQMYWMDHFNKTQRNRNGKKLPKGFLEIIY